MLTILLRAVSALPLVLLHAIGSLLGRSAFALDRTLRSRATENLAAGATAGLREVPTTSSVARELGKSVAELPWVWLKPLDSVLAAVEIDPASAACVAAPGATIFLTPHLGCFEVAAQYIASVRPITVMYRRPKIAALDPLMRAGREKGAAKLIAADMSGVRAMLKALKSGESIGVLPDQVPGQGEGVWVPFFGRSAYTMTLIGRLAASTGARVVMTIAERKTHGHGYRLHFDALLPLPASPTEAARALNAALEQAIARCPAQYLWTYNRYKVPAGVAAPSSAMESRA